MDCPFCHPHLCQDDIVLESQYSYFTQVAQPILIGSGLIIPKNHRVTVFDLTVEEWNDAFILLNEVKLLLDERFHPSGYNIGWNSGAVAGQEIFHAHLHVIPRYMDEPYAGRGIRYWLKQEENRRSLT